MLVSAAVCPHPPILVPAMAGAAARELDGLRAACDEAVRRLAAARPDALVVAGGAPATAVHGSDAHATLRPYGLPWTSPDVPGDGGEALPLSLTIGRWLIERAGDPAAQGRGFRAGYRSVAFDAPPEECLAIGRDIAASAERVGLLVMGDGSACRSEKAPGYLDERAEPYDEAVARALGKADAAALAALDPGTSRELRVAGRAAWQVLAGAAGTGRFSGDLLADEAPYGVAYFVASWSAGPSAGPDL
ncbi:class III extradiol dioxygenase subunit B-like domain-containing protein [Actinomadura algeriensis]|uniref:Catalytic LigB subunit of aromatic ring-opening dioxygenase n=1 Tax=Actinomadura algeriensis TaxID=1679523 RepID=A0ABR9JX76_9ACTN|nr:class III extradiol dioxygenase subunit B-like domain-containing protein [Actinomadura algeriensis]MBE1534946.1 hypothetical protein [Actinomadura algeriensis]